MPFGSSILDLMVPSGCFSCRTLIALLLLPRMEGGLVPVEMRKPEEDEQLGLEACVRGCAKGNHEENEKAIWEGLESGRLLGFHPQGCGDEPEERSREEKLHHGCLRNRPCEKQDWGDDDEGERRPAEWLCDRDDGFH